MFELRYDKDTCLNCPTYDCLTKCLYMELDKDAAKLEIKKIINGQDSPVLQDCVLCYACEEYCKWGNHPMFLIAERLEEKNMKVIPEFITESLINSYNPLVGELKITTVKEPVIDMCWNPQLVDLSIQGKLFEGLSILPGDIDSQRHFGCQAIYLHTGSPSITKKYLPKVVENIASHNVKEVICAHDECYGMFTLYASAVGLEVPFKPVHLFEYLYNRLRELQDEIKPLNIKAAYQRPCSSRLSSDKFHFVDDIFNLIGVESVKREYTGEKALCCGAAIRDQAREGRLQLTADVQSKNIADMLEAGAEVCAFNCPYCFETLAEQLTQKGIKPIFISDLCRLAIGEKPRDYGVHLPLEMRGEIALGSK